MTPPLPPEIAWLYSLAALTNARELNQAAHHLLEREQYGVARSLAISAREELGKFFRALFAALEVTKTSRTERGLKSHTGKQATGAVAAALPDFANLNDIGLDLSAEAIASTHELMRLVGDRLLAATDSLSFDASPLEAVERSVEAAERGDDESARRRGLYVDVEWDGSSWSLRTPSEITRDEAKAEVERLDAILDHFDGKNLRVALPPGVESLPIPDLESMRQMLARLASAIWAK